MASAKSKLLHSIGAVLFRYIYKNPKRNMLRLVKLGKKFAGNMYPESTFKTPIEIISNENNIWHDYLFNGMNDIDKEFLQHAVLTFGIDLGLIGTSTLRKKRDEMHCNIPWVVLLDPTSACNLKCKGCWAAEYGYKSNLSLDEMRKIIFECNGVYNKTLDAMAVLKKHGCIFGTSICYTSKNYEAVTSDEFYDKMIECGAKYMWYFHYMPVGGDADTELLLTPEQREHVYRSVREKRNNKTGKPIFTVDFQNDAEFVGGCIAGGRNYFHINSEGDAEPCVFIHYSDSNIREKSILECLKSPLFNEYYKGQPFNKNMLRPCPMLENPQALRKMVERSGAKSTNLLCAESANALCAKCDAYAKSWAPRAKEIWEEKERFKPFTQYYRDTPEGKTGYKSEDY